MPEDLKLSQIGSSPLPPPFRGLHSPGVRKHCQIIFACYLRKSSIHSRLTKNYARSWIKTGHASLMLVQNRVLRSVHEASFLRTYLWWSSCTLYLLACQMRVTVRDSGVCCCVHLTSLERRLTPLYVELKVGCCLVMGLTAVEVWTERLRQKRSLILALPCLPHRHWKKDQ